LSCALAIIAPDVCESDARTVDVTCVHTVEITVRSLDIGIGALVVVCGTGD
jgi:hypothetical protein